MVCLVTKRKRYVILKDAEGIARKENRLQEVFLASAAFLSIKRMIG